MNELNKHEKTVYITFLIILFLLVAIPAGIGFYFHTQTDANNKTIHDDRIEIKRLKAQQKKKKKVIYEHGQSIKQLNTRLHDATNQMISCQNVFLKKKRSAVSPDAIDNAERTLASITAKDLAFPNDLIFDLGKEPLTLRASYPSQFKLSQNQIPVTIHAYNHKNQETAFCVLYFDPIEHVFTNYVNYSITRDPKKSKGTDYRAFQRQQEAAAKQKAQEKHKANNKKTTKKGKQV